jgi:4-hydroxy-3-methylbut-2-en-1-yl diphosphate synthase IspG/GcpE
MRLIEEKNKKMLQSKTQQIQNTQQTIQTENQIRGRAQRIKRRAADEAQSIQFLKDFKFQDNKFPLTTNFHFSLKTTKCY